MTNYNSPKKLHNPKSHAPAVYIPCWLIQIPINLLSHGAKMTYGRLSQWATSNGTVFRSANQLAQELGCSSRSIKDYLSELKRTVVIFYYRVGKGEICFGYLLYYIYKMFRSGKYYVLAVVNFYLQMQALICKL